MKRLVMYTNENSRSALWMYGPMDSTNSWKVLTSKDVGYDVMSFSHALVNDDNDDCDELVHAAKFMITTHGKICTD